MDLDHITYMKDKIGVVRGRDMIGIILFILIYYNILYQTSAEPVFSMATRGAIRA